MKRGNAARFGASVTLAAMVTAGFPWTSVLAGWSISAILALIAPVGTGRIGRVPAALAGIMALPVTAAVLLGADRAFPEETTFPFVSLALLAVLFRAMLGRREGLERVSVLLGIFLLGILGTVTVWGLMDVKWTENLPELPAAWTVLLSASAGIPWWGAGIRERKGGAWLGASAGISLGLSLLTRGVLGRALAAWEPAPLYRAVQTIRILGTLQRLEAFLAGAVLMGAMILLLWMGEMILSAGEIFLGRPMKTPEKGGLLLAAFLLEWVARVLPPEILVPVETAFWGFLPAFALGVVELGKFEKRG